MRDVAGALLHRPRHLLPTLLVVSGVVAAFGLPLLLDTYSVNVLTRSLLLAVAAVTVDLLWG